MRESKRNRLLNGVTGIRIRLKISQLALAQYLGVSESLISMVENGHRHLTEAALLKITDLSLDYYQRQASGDNTPFILPAYRESDFEIAVRNHRKALRVITLEQQKMKLARVIRQYDETLVALRELEPVLQLVRAGGSRFGLAAMEQSQRKLLKRLQRVDGLAQAKLRGRIAMLEIMIEADEVDTIARTKAIEGTEQQPLTATVQAIPQGYKVAAWRLKPRQLPHSYAAIMSREYSPPWAAAGESPGR